MLTLRKLGSSLLTVSMTAASSAFHLTISAIERAVTYLGSLTSPRGGLYRVSVESPFFRVIVPSLVAGGMDLL